ncbi:MAG: transposase [Chlamydiia bacterium]|nr:transposase [Chlamydiia bacterium]
MVRAAIKFKDSLKEGSKKIEVHYTPKHGSWLNIAEIEISALIRQSLKRRLESAESVARELDAAVEERNRLEKKIHWAFSTEQVRVKLARIYC